VRLTPPPRNRPRGHALVEVLVAAVVLAVGLAGGVSLLLDGVRASRGARQATAAAGLVSDLGERIRANPTAGDAYALAAGDTPPPPAARCATGCDASAIAAADLDEWRRAAESALPGVLTAVAVAAVEGGTTRRYTITVEWIVAGRDEPARLDAVVVA
jgi:type IV pilus modification protein PilV